MSEIDLKRELRKVRRELRDLTVVVKQSVKALDAEMQKPSDVDRGKRIAAIANALEFQNDTAIRFALRKARKPAPRLADASPET